MRKQHITLKKLSLFVLLTSLCFGFGGCDDDDDAIVYNPDAGQTTEDEDNDGDNDPNTGPTEDIVTLPKLSVVGRYLKNEQGEIVNLHGFTQTYSPFFNNNAWSNYDVDACLAYNKRMVDEILAAGWRLNFVRMHLDPYWSDDTSLPQVRYEGHERFSEERFRKYLDELFVPMAEYFLSKGMYVVMRPPGVSPNTEGGYQGIEVGDSYQQFLLKVWGIISNHSKLKNNTGIMFELANEPVKIKGTDGVYGSSGDACFESMKTYFQAIIDRIRNNGSRNIIWVPGLSYQSSFAGFATHRLEGENLGFAVHCYPGWYGSDAEEDSNEGIGTSTGGGYEAFQQGWDAQVGPVAAFAPIMVTEIDWAPAKYDATWGKSITGVAGGEGFGANFKYIADNSGNVSWLFFTTRSHELAAFRPVAPADGNYTFLTDPEACPWPMWHWFKEYAEGTSADEKTVVSIAVDGVAEGGRLTMGLGTAFYLKVRATYTDGTSELVTAKATVSTSDPNVLDIGTTGRIVGSLQGVTSVVVAYESGGARAETTFTADVSSPFQLTASAFNPSIWETGTFDEQTKTLVTGKYGFGGWQFPSGLDLSGYSTITVTLGAANTCGASFRLFDQTSYWTDPAQYDFGSSRSVSVDLRNMKSTEGRSLDPSHLYIIGFWSTGGQPIVIESVTLSK